MIKYSQEGIHSGKKKLVKFCFSKGVISRQRSKENSYAVIPNKRRYNTHKHFKNFHLFLNR